MRLSGGEARKDKGLHMLSGGEARKDKGLHMPHASYTGLAPAQRKMSAPFSAGTFEPDTCEREREGEGEERKAMT